MRSDMNSIKRHSSPESQIVLATLNARYIHSSFGLRYIKANMAELEENTTIVEFTLDPKPEDIAEQLLSLEPQVLAMSVYIWNTVQTQAVLAIVRELKPDLPIIVGGPEVSYEIESQVIFSLVDYVVAGWGDISVPALCHQLILRAAARINVSFVCRPWIKQHGHLMWNYFWRKWINFINAACVNLNLSIELLI